MNAILLGNSTFVKVLNLEDRNLDFEQLYHDATTIALIRARGQLVDYMRGL